MKFGKRLAEEMISFWRDDYISYKRLKHFVHNTTLHGDAFVKELFTILYEELEKAEKLFEALLEELAKGVPYLIALQPNQIIEPPPRKGIFYQRRRHHHHPASSPSSSLPTRVDESENQAQRSSPTTSKQSGYGACTDKDHAVENCRVSFSCMSVEPVEAPLLQDYQDETKCKDVIVSIAERNQSSLSGWFEDEEEESCRPSKILQRMFLRLIGDSYLKFKPKNTPEAAYLEWNANAHKLQHFAELNLESIRKTLKKVKKHHSDEPDIAVDIDILLSRSKLSRDLPTLSKLMETVEADFDRKFHEPLDRYATLSLAEHWHIRWKWFLLSILFFFITLHIPILHDNPPAHNCLALFSLVIVLWLSEAIPFFCTAMLIPLFAVPLSIISDPATGLPASPSQASQIVLGKLFNHVQILVMGGLTIGKAFGRTNLDAYAVSTLHRFSGHRPSIYLLSLMLSSCILCAFVSNVAAPLLVISVIRHTLWELPPDTNAPKGMLLGVAFACNLGGMLSPIASPQNAVAIAVLSFHDVSFGKWICIALPVVLLSVIVAWAIVLKVWKPFEDVLYIPLQVTDMARVKKVAVADQIVVLATAIVTIFLWVLPSNFIFGDTGIVALIPIVVLFGMGILSKDDFNTLSWHLMFLLAGGNMLGLCARDSKMLDILALSLRETLRTTSPYTSVVIVTVIVGVVTTFVSHTVAAMILLPMIAKIGFLMPENQHSWLSASPQSLVMLASLMCSGAMAFPISSFPNVNSLMTEDAHGKAYLRAKDFLFSGFLVTIFFTLCLITWMVPYTFFSLQ